MIRLKSFTIVGGALTLLLLITILSLLWGQYPIDLPTFMGYMEFKLFGGVGNDTYTLLDNIILQIRLPRVLLAILIGASLAVSGAAFQAMFVNPLVSPGILGVLAGAAFGAALGMLISEQWYVVQILAFIFGFVAVGVAVAIGGMVSNSRSTIMLVLGGVISSSLFTALLSVIKYVADPYSTLPAIVYWLMGSLTMADLSQCPPRQYPDPFEHSGDDCPLQIFRSPQPRR
jgi:iron complex transport system permease protein